MKFPARVFRNISALLLATSLLLGIVAGAVGCASEPPAPSPLPEEPPTDWNDGTENVTWHLPDPMDFAERRSIPYEDMVFSREALTTAENGLSAWYLQAQNSADNELILLAIARAVHDLNFEYLETQIILASIRYCADYENNNLQSDLVYAQDAYFSCLNKAEKLLTFLANTAYADKLDASVFSPGFLASYREGGRYTDEVVVLCRQLLLYQVEYLNLNADTAVITFRGVTGRACDIEKSIQDMYAGSPDAERLALQEFRTVRDKTVVARTRELFYSLTVARGKLARALGYADFAAYQYEKYGRAYSVSDVENLTAALRNYVLPLCRDNNLGLVFSYNTAATIPLSAAQLFNTLYDILKEKDTAYADAYTFMMQYGMYNLGTATGGARYDRAFTTYLSCYDAPFLFLNTTGTVADFITASRAFGRYTGAFLHGENVGADPDALYADGLSFLFLASLASVVQGADYDALRYAALEQYLNDAESNAMLSDFERRLYALDPDSLTMEAMDAIAAQVAQNYNAYSVTGYEQLLDSRTILLPCRSFSRVISVVVALRLYFTEWQNPGEGYRQFNAWLHAEKVSLSDLLTGTDGVNLFDPDALKAMVNDIYLSVIGRKFYESADSHLTA